MNTMLKEKAGFSLLELLIVIAIGAILLTAALPAVGEYLRSNRLTSQTNTLVAALHFARGEAITRNQNVFLSALDGAWSKGWEVWIDGRQDGDGKCVPGANPPNRTREDCESLRVFDFSAYVKTYPQITTVPVSLETVSGALLEAALLKSSLMFRGSDGSLAVGNSTATVSFYICDSDSFGDKSKLRPGRQLTISRSGRVSLVNDTVSPTACPPS